ncbi:ABC transporter substrate-binding protein [Serratia plymuthica]|uniref:ABC transporter substrate-binding protein n=1 Tax=Serratia plymuthica TaxID=82996 RepID=UPI001BB02DA8|nr:ABC transporter substrate-binding protein [Serratia plymuthica]QUY49304.1 ABC transporter substrate-binding protein [Serratia plymuthica]
MRNPFVLLLLSLLFGVFSAQAKMVTDITGRQVKVPDNPQRIVLGESRMLYTLALLEPGNPAQRVVGWPEDMARYDAQSWQLYTQKFPQIKAIPSISKGNFLQVNVENLIQLKPDLVILARYAREEGDSSFLLTALNKAGIAVIYVDLRVDLLNNTVPSVRLLGEVLNRQQRAEQFISFYQQHMAVIRQRLAGYQGPKPKVMLHLHLGRRETCCTTAAHGNLGDLLAFAGGDNIANASIKGVYGELNPETILTANPDIYIATGMAGPQGKRFSDLRLGPLVTQQEADESFRMIMQKQPMLANLKAIKTHQAWSIWHNFYLSPYHVVAVEMFAKAFYPDLFADINPQQTFKQLYQQFLPLPFSGAYWSQLNNE